ncbi:hypothetical protein [Haloarcula marismortui]|uniref:Uncharacterized protein n=1 Tax=Haloarcula marismortui ATCC 33800 TaxID=662476 RepID=M0JVA4_9EURY|nr:hypothetical protein [Haloarcula sinaiiensis]EMA12328.1 hypothetical protein C436_14459 [Haloarcula sinaiiensis ATCC 33800]QUJ71267.1 hypothetical protein KDQ40_11140 [Haloarcula sinaiiensis ATCC 33800]
MTQAKGGNITLELDAPQSVQPGQSFEATARVHNGGLYINPWEPDRCTGEASGGYMVRVDLEGPEGQTRTQGPMCVRMVNVGTGTEEVTKTFSAPESPGEYEVSANAVLPGSGTETGDETEYVVVSNSEPAEPDPDNSDDDSDDGNGIPAWLTGNNSDDDDDSSPAAQFFGLDMARIKLYAGLLGLLLALWALSPYASLAAAGADALGGR